MRKSIPSYLVKIIKKYPNILSGRKNIKNQHARIIKNLNLVAKFINKKKFNIDDN